MTEDRFSEIRNDVKLVIWDLDETFWNGTLSEGGISIVRAHVKVVEALVDRGIMCSICSKNDRGEAMAQLVELGIWDKFVFAHIDWSPKGAAVRAIIDRMGLRPENVVFIDDNHLNLEEARFFCPEIACVDATGSTDGGQHDLSGLLSLAQMTGKDDRSHSRLQQYKVMETKEKDQKSGGLSNEDFLRQSEIKVRIITEFDDKMDRVLELINRTNQLNFTKIRANTAEERRKLSELLRISGIHAGLVEVRDRYGDYGIVGFFCVRTRFSGTTVHHFAFSCRTLNMGVEQWVWNHLGRPEFAVVGPVASRLVHEKEIDWIAFDDGSSQDDNAPERKICMVGGCDLLQVSFYCGSNRVEFVNKQDDEGNLVRFDDVGFFLNSRDNWLRSARPVRAFGYALDEMLSLDSAIADSDLILLSLYFSVPADNLFSYGPEGKMGQYLGQIPPRRYNRLLRDPEYAAIMARDLYLCRFSRDERIDLAVKCIARAYSLKRPRSPLFVVGATLNYGQQALRTRAIRLAFNEKCRDFCSSHDEAVFIDLDELLPEEDFVDSDHYTRKGYFRIAEFINSSVTSPLAAE